jgi:hypothetical protein
MIHVHKRFCYNVFPTCVLCIVSKRLDIVVEQWTTLMIKGLVAKLIFGSSNPN